MPGPPNLCFANEVGEEADIGAFKLLMQVRALSQPAAVQRSGDARTNYRCGSRP